MKRYLLIFLLFLIYGLQIYIVFNGVTYFGKYINPFVLFLSAVSFVGIYLSYLKSCAPIHFKPDSKWMFRTLGAFIGGMSVMIYFLPFRELLRNVLNHGKISDVMPQLETLYHRFDEGIFPYSNVYLELHQAFPVYMPLHWMPIGITEFINKDARWIGFIFLFLAMSMVGFFLFKKNKRVIIQIIAIFLTSLPIFAFLRWDELDLAVSLETLIAAYYILLGLGLILRDIRIITIGLICCILSRYTLVFWIPLFAIFLFQKESLKLNVGVWSSVGLSVLLIYVLPFLLKDPTILAKGIQYHNKAAVAEWVGYGEPPISYSMESGIHTAALQKSWFSGTMKERVSLSRMIQGMLMLVFLIMGYLGYKCCFRRMSIYDFSLAMLYLCIMLFYIFGPLTYRYYMLVPLMLAGLMCVQISGIKAYSA